MTNSNDRQTIQSLRLSINEALEILHHYNVSRDALSELPTAISILEAAYEFTDPKLLDKDCGCG